MHYKFEKRVLGGVFMASFLIALIMVFIYTTSMSQEKRVLGAFVHLTGEFGD